jgi:CRISPR-associated protein Cas2
VRRKYIVTYDITEPKRLNRVCKTLKGYGDHLEYSVFECDLSDAEMVILRGRLSDIINHRDDQVLFIDLGSVESARVARVDSLGRAYTPIQHDVPVY